MECGAKEESDKKNEKRGSGRERGGNARLRAVPIFPQGKTKRKASARENHPTPPRLAFLAWGDFYARSPFARSTIPEEKWGLIVV